MLRMDQVHVVRHKVLVEGRTQRSVARELGLSRTTVSKYVEQAMRSVLAIIVSSVETIVGSAAAMQKLIATLVLAALSAAALFAQPAPARQDRPNVVLIITDDVGYGDIGSYGAPDIKTPHIDSLAKTGTRFTDFYANGSTCTPTRAGLISGRYQQRYALERPLGHATSADGDLGLPASAYSLPQLLRGSGYATGLIGKWHLGHKPQFSPLAHGFESFFGFKSGYIDYYEHTDNGGQPDLFENDAAIAMTGYMTDLITDRSLKFIAANASRPFFLEVAYNAPHWPYQVPDHPSKAIENARHVMPYDDNPGTRADYVTILERADEGVGQILATLGRSLSASARALVKTGLAA